MQVGRHSERMQAGRQAGMQVGRHSERMQAGWHSEQMQPMTHPWSSCSCTAQGPAASQLPALPAACRCRLELFGCKVVAKLEDMEGLVNHKEILEAADAVVFSRGSLGTCMPVEKVRARCGLLGGHLQLIRAPGMQQGQGSLWAGARREGVCRPGDVLVLQEGAHRMPRRDAVLACSGSRACTGGVFSLGLQKGRTRTCWPPCALQPCRPSLLSSAPSRSLSVRDLMVCAGVLGPEDAAACRQRGWQALLCDACGRHADRLVVQPRA